MNFPAKLYVSEPLEGQHSTQYDAYTTWADSEEDDTIAVYVLEGTYRVKHKKRAQLVEEHNGKLAEIATYEEEMK